MKEKHSTFNNRRPTAKERQGKKGGENLSVDGRRLKKVYREVRAAPAYTKYAKAVSRFACHRTPRRAPNNRYMVESSCPGWGDGTTSGFAAKAHDAEQYQSHQKYQ
jgi:hypothetical protein